MSEALPFDQHYTNQISDQNEVDITPANLVSLAPRMLTGSKQEFARQVFPQDDLITHTVRNTQNLNMRAPCEIHNK